MFKVILDYPLNSVLFHVKAASDSENRVIIHRASLFKIWASRVYTVCIGYSVNLATHLIKNMFNVDCEGPVPRVIVCISPYVGGCYI